MEAWYLNQSFFNQGNLDRIKAWMEPGSFNVVEIYPDKEVS